MTSIFFVSVNQSFKSNESLFVLEPFVERAWPISLEKAAACDRVVALYKTQPVAAWRIRGAFESPWTYGVGKATRPRVALSLGDPLPVIEAYRTGAPKEVLVIP